MTTFAACVGVDARAPASVYLASDSRISWVQGSRFWAWDHGRKVFACHTQPDMFGYVGDVLFPSLVLGQVVDAIDGGTFSATDGPGDRFGVIEAMIRSSFDALPKSEQREFTIVYGTRHGEKMESRFYLGTLSWSVKGGWERKELAIPSVSSYILITGSGGGGVRRWNDRWLSSSQGGTSRAVFAGFCDALEEGTDRHTGGAPQLVGLYRIGPARTFGISWGGRAYVNGLELECPQESEVEWRNRLFELCDPDGERLVGAQSHHVPKGLGHTRSQGTRRR